MVLPDDSSGTHVNPTDFSMAVGHYCWERCDFCFQKRFVQDSKATSKELRQPFPHSHAATTTTINMASSSTLSFTEIFTTIQDWANESNETPTQRALKKKLPHLDKNKSKKDTNVNNNNNSTSDSFWSLFGLAEASPSTAASTDLQDLNTLARLRCWSAIEQCASQIDSVHHTTLTKAGSAPLHSAISNGAPLSTIQALVVANPPSVAFPNHFGNLPLHFCAWKNKAPEAFSIGEFLLTYYPQAAKHSNRHGNLPLHHATNYKASIDVVQLLWRAYPAGVSRPNDKGLTPLDYALRRHGASHPIVLMLQGSTSRNYVYPKYHSQQQQPHDEEEGQGHPQSLEGLYLERIAATTTTTTTTTAVMRNNQDRHHQEDAQSQSQQQQRHRYSTAKEALPEIQTDTWHEVDL